jgi:anti-sigma B factor antagonist
MLCQGCASASEFARDETCPLGLPSGPPPEAAAAADGPALAVSILARDEYRLARLEGEVDLATACALHFLLRAQLAAGPRLAVDVAGLAFTDVLGIRMLARAATQAADAGGWVRLIGARPQFRRLLELLGEEWLLPVYEDEDAVAKDRGARP